jgi:hypothetical protein
MIVEVRKMVVGGKKEVTKMGWQTIVALVVMVPVMLFPVVLVWYINVGGIMVALREARARKAAKETAREQKVVNK